MIKLDYTLETSVRELNHQYYKTGDDALLEPIYNALYKLSYVLILKYITNKSLVNCADLAATVAADFTYKIKDGLVIQAWTIFLRKCLYDYEVYKDVWSGYSDLEGIDVVSTSKEHYNVDVKNDIRFEMELFYNELVKDSPYTGSSLNGLLFMMTFLSLFSDCDPSSLNNKRLGFFVSMKKSLLLERLRILVRH